MYKKTLFIFLIALGVFLRVYQVTSHPGGFFLDEVNMAVDVKNLVENGTDQYGRPYPFVFEDVTDYKLPVYIYGSTFFYALLGPQLISIRLLALIASLLSILSFGYITRLLFKKNNGLVYFVMIITALSPFAVHFARIGYETTLATFLISIFLISLLKSFEKNTSKKWYVLGILTSTLATWTYPAARFIIPVFLFSLFAVSFLSFSTPERKKVRVSSLLFLISSIISFIPTIIFSPTANARSLSYIFYGTDGTGIQFFTTKLLQVASSFLRLWNLEFLFDKGDTFAHRHGTKEVGIFFSLFLIPYVVGIIHSIKKVNRHNFSHLFLIVLTLVCALPSSLTSTTPYGTRIVTMLLPYSILIGVGLQKILFYISQLSYAKKRFVSMLTVAVFCYQFLFFYHVYFTHFRITGAPEFSTAPTQLGLYIKDRLQQHPEQTVYFLNDKSCRNWGQDTLHLWYFANLSNPEMIRWNTLFRDKRYQAPVSPFDAYDSINIPSFHVKKDNIVLYPGYISTDNTPKGSVYVRCGFQLESFDKNNEKLLKVFYISSEVEMDPYYVVTQKIR